MALRSICTAALAALLLTKGEGQTNNGGNQPSVTTITDTGFGTFVNGVYQGPKTGDETIDKFLALRG